MIREDVLQQFGQLGGLRGGDGDDPVADAGVELGRSGQAFRRDAADHLGRVAQLVVGPTGIDALGRKGDVEVVADPQFGFLLGQDVANQEKLPDWRVGEQFHR